MTNKSPKYLSKFPLGKIPAFEDNKGFKCLKAPLSHAMVGCTHARYLAPGSPTMYPVSSFVPKSSLLGKDSNKAALVDQWV